MVNMLWTKSDKIDWTHRVYIQVTSESLSAALSKGQSVNKVEMASIEHAKQQMRQRAKVSDNLIDQIRRETIQRDRVQKRHEQLAARRDKLEQEHQKREQKLTKWDNNLCQLRIYVLISVW